MEATSVVLKISDKRVYYYQFFHSIIYRCISKPNSPNKWSSIPPQEVPKTHHSHIN